MPARDVLIDSYLRVPAGARHLVPQSFRRRALHVLGRFAPWEAGFDLTPPPTTCGEEPGPPDFVGIGAQKSGTTWWYELITTHPGVHTRAEIHKERHYFDRFAREPFGTDDARRYRGWFPRRPGTISGEWTPDYMVQPWAPALLARAAPQTKLLVLLRDPVERLFSGLAHEIRMGATLIGPVLADAFERGLYHRYLGLWLRHYHRDQLLVLQYERCLADTEGQLQRTFGFLGLTEYWVAETERPVAPERVPSRDIHPDVRHRLASLYEDDVTALAAEFAGIDLGLWPSFSYLTVGDGQARSSASASRAVSAGPSSPSRRE